MAGDDLMDILLDRNEELCDMMNEVELFESDYKRLASSSDIPSRKDADVIRNACGFLCELISTRRLRRECAAGAGESVGSPAPIGELAQQLAGVIEGASQLVQEFANLAVENDRLRDSNRLLRETTKRLEVQA